MMLNAQSNKYCLVYGQMSHWGKWIASNVIIYFFLNISLLRRDISLLQSNIFKFYNAPHSGIYPTFWVGHLKTIIKICVKRSDVINFNKPLDKEILEIIYGSLLGDASAEKRKGGKGTRILFYQEGSHNEYLLFLHRLIANLGYCNTNIPKLQTRISNNGKIRKIIRFSTWTYDQFNEIHKNWYIPAPSGSGYGASAPNGKKVLPNDIDQFLSPLALAIWIMDNGGKIGKGLKLATNNFTLNEVKQLIAILDVKYNIKSTIHKTGAIDQYNIYILSDSMPILVKKIKPYIVPSMKYKLGNYI